MLNASEYIEAILIKQKLKGSIKKKKDTEGELMENTAPAFKINIHTLGGGLNI